MSLCSMSKITPWRLSDDLFDEFAIFGYETYTRNETPKVLYLFPPKEQTKIDYRMICYDNQFDGVIKDTKVPLLDHIFSSSAQEHKEMINIRNDPSRPSYMYIISYKCSSMNRPIVYTNGFLEGFRNGKQGDQRPTYMVIVTTHKFPTLFYKILAHFKNIEILLRISHHKDILNVINYNETDTKWVKDCNAFRDHYLQAIYTSHLPAFGELMTFSTSFLPPLEWKMPVKDERFSDMLISNGKCLYEKVLYPDLMIIVSALLTETKIAIVGSDKAELTKTISVLPSLVLPFIVIATVLTCVDNKDRLDYFESPNPMIYGVYTDFENEIPQGILVYNLDRKKFRVNVLKIPPLPENQDLNEFKTAYQSKFPIEKCFRFLYNYLENLFVQPILNSFVNYEFDMTKFRTSMSKYERFVDKLVETQGFNVYVNQLGINQKEKKVHDNQCKTISSLFDTKPNKK